MPGAVASTTPTLPPAGAQTASEAGALAATRRRRRYTLLTPQDKLLIALMVGVPLTLDLLLIWGPTLASICFSFTNRERIRPITTENLFRLKKYQVIFTGDNL